MFFHQRIILILLVLTCSVSYAQQSVKQYVEASAVQVKHIDFEQDDFTDLQALGKAIGNARIVALGEQMHGDGTSFQAKARIVRYLHQQKGFKLLVFESDGFGLTEGFAKARTQTKDTLNQFIYNNLIGLWSWCKNLEPLLYDYVYQTQQTNNPLLLAGMDCQNQSRYTFQHLQQSLAPILTKLMRHSTDSLQVQEVLRQLPTTFFNGQKADPEGCAKGLAALESLLRAPALQQLNPAETNLLNNVLAAFRNILPLLQNKRDDATKHLYRDRQMFENLLYLLQHKYPGEKMIVWAHNAHIMKALHAFSNQTDSVRMLGQLLGNAAINPFRYYALGITSYNARSVWTATISQPIEAHPPMRNSFERWINKDWAYAFVDWTAFNQSGAAETPFLMKGSFEFSQHMNYSAQWNRLFDGVLFIRNIEGCTNINQQDILKQPKRNDDH
jgi:erythromycin esterase-like protein